MQDEFKLYAHADNEFEAEADEYPDELEDGFDDDEEEEEVSVIVSSTPVIAELDPPPSPACRRVRPCRVWTATCSKAPAALE